MSSRDNPWDQPCSSKSSYSRPKRPKAMMTKAYEVSGDANRRFIGAQKMRRVGRRTIEDDVSSYLPSTSTARRLPSKMRSTVDAITLDDEEPECELLELSDDADEERRKREERQKLLKDATKKFLSTRKRNEEYLNEMRTSEDEIRGDEGAREHIRFNAADVKKEESRGTETEDTDTFRDVPSTSGAWTTFTRRRSPVDAVTIADEEPERESFELSDDEERRKRDERQKLIEDATRKYLLTQKGNKEYLNERTTRDSVDEQTVEYGCMNAVAVPMAGRTSEDEDNFGAAPSNLAPWARSSARRSPVEAITIDDEEPERESFEVSDDEGRRKRDERQKLIEDATRKYLLTQKGNEEYISERRTRGYEPTYEHTRFNGAAIPLGGRTTVNENTSSDAPSTSAPCTRLSGRLSPHDVVTIDDDELEEPDVEVIEARSGECRTSWEMQERTREVERLTKRRNEMAANIECFVDDVRTKNAQDSRVHAPWFDPAPAFARGVHSHLVHGQTIYGRSYPPPAIDNRCHLHHNHGRTTYAREDIPRKWNPPPLVLDWKTKEDFEKRGVNYNAMYDRLHKGRHFRQLTDGEKWLLRNRGVNPRNGRPQGGIWREGVLYWRSVEQVRYEEYQPWHEHPMFKWPPQRKPPTLESQARERVLKMEKKRAEGMDSDTTDNEEYSDSEVSMEDKTRPERPGFSTPPNASASDFYARIFKRWRLKRKRCSCDLYCKHFESYWEKNGLFEKLNNEVAEWRQWSRSLKPCERFTRNWIGVRDRMKRIADLWRKGVMI